MVAMTAAVVIAALVARPDLGGCVTSSPGMMSAAAAEGATSRRMPSGAGHDAMVIGRRVPAAMIFIPSRGGISHSPEEYSSPAEIELGMRVLAETLRQSLRADEVGPCA